MEFSLQNRGIWDPDKMFFLSHFFLAYMEAKSPHPQVLYFIKNCRFFVLFFFHKFDFIDGF